MLSKVGQCEKKQLNRRILLCSVELRGRVHLLGTRSSCTPVIKEATTRTFSRLTCVFKNEELCVHTFYALVFYFCRSRLRLTRMRSDLVITLCPRTSYMSWNTWGSSNLPSENQKKEK